MLANCPYCKKQAPYGAIRYPYCGQFIAEYNEEEQSNRIYFTKQRKRTKQQDIKK